MMKNEKKNILLFNFSRKLLNFINFSTNFKLNNIKNNFFIFVFYRYIKKLYNFHDNG